MLGLGWTEMLVIGVVALIFIGPKDLPVVMGRVGKVIGQIQRMGREFQREINKTTGLDEVRNLRSSITSPLKQTADEIRREFNAIGKDGKVQPSGAIKPTDPKVESVVDAIHEKAGMTPPKTSSQLATEYGFKPTATAASAPVEPATPAPASEPVKATRKPVRSAKPTRASMTATETAPVEPAPAETAPAPKSRVRKSTAKAAAPVIDAQGAPAEPAPKPRAPRLKKAASTAEKSE